MTTAEYLLKFSLCLAVLYVFYRVVLRPLTFYQWNRFFLLVYSLLAFVLPFMNITPWIGERTEGNNWVNQVPAIDKYTLHSKILANPVEWNKWIILLVGIGAAVMLVRIIIQYFSLSQIRKDAELIYSGDDVHLYGIVKKISPFSFGNSIYINRELHSEEELQRIIQHEIVHVRQQHTLDIILGELLCMINWFNPFAWLIRSAIRQNLEFIADNNVLLKGHDKKEYQYLLLKVIGVPKYSIANNFNLPHLKKRIAMMNKMKTAKIHLTKFLFALPLAVLILLAFRTERTSQNKIIVKQVAPGKIIADTVPELALSRTDVGVYESKVNSHGYLVTLLEDNNEGVVVIRDKTRRIIKVMALSEWNKDRHEYEKTYGKITAPPPPPPAPPVPAAPAPGAPVPAAPRPPRPADPNGRVEIRAQPAPEPVEPPTPPVAPDARVIIKELHDEVRAKSLNKNSPEEPLYIVDNKEASQEEVHEIDPAAIEAVIVTKGKAATDAYGTKGKNGVVELHTIPKSSKKSAGRNSLISVTVEDAKTDSLSK